ncbi:MAG TPA: Ig-like domain-containing protein [Candidatus Cybelea sp.]|nr:Ig-like domain-containing protein [Candidatus Cybelea sp.]
MANDSSLPNSHADDMAASAGERSGDSYFDHDHASDGVFGAEQLAEATTPGNAPAQAPAAQPDQTIHFQLPQGGTGPQVVRVPVAAGDIVDLPAPFDSHATLEAKEGNGNLAIKVGDVTIILQGYIAASNDPQHPVTIDSSDGKPIDIATVLASTDPTADIQTAAGPGAANAGQGADNTGAILTDFGAGAGLAGFGAVGALDGTALQYGLIDNSIRQEIAGTVSPIFGFSIGPVSGFFDEQFLRDPAEQAPLGDFGNFLTQYKDAVENPGNPLFPGWADFRGTGATDTNFDAYLAQTKVSVIVDAHFTGATGDLVLTGVEPGITSNGAPLYVEQPPADGGHTLFIRRDDADNALVAVVHVEQLPNGEFQIDTYMINRIDHPTGDTGDAGRDSVQFGVDFTVYDGPAPNPEQPSGPTPPSLDGKFDVSWHDDVPLLTDVVYHNENPGGGVTVTGSSGGGSTTDSYDMGLVDEDWLKHGNHDKDHTQGDTIGSTCVTGQIDVNFGADGPAQSDNPGFEPSDKHAFVLDTSNYTVGEDFPFNGGTLTSGGQTLVVLSVGPDHLLVGIGAPAESEGEGAGAGKVTGIPIFCLTLDQDTGEFKFQLDGPLDHPSDLVFNEAGVNALTTLDPENNILIDFGVTAFDDDGDFVPATIHIQVNDDVPVAHADCDTVAAGTYGPECGNVITGAGTDSPWTGHDWQGADGASVTGVVSGTPGGDTDGNVGDKIDGNYGTLTLDADGHYTYTRNAHTPGGVDDVFTYTLTDGDGDKSSTTLTIHIGNAGVTVTPPDDRGETTVYEAGLPIRGTEPAGSGEIADHDGTNDSDPSEHTTGIVTVAAPDGVSTLQVDGNTALTLADLNGLSGSPVTYTDANGGELTLTGYNEATGELSYTYTLTDNTLTDPSSVSFDIKVTDIDGSTGDGALKITIIDDRPTANPDTNAVNSGDETSGNVVTNDVSGADGFALTGAVVGVATGSDTSAPVSGNLDSLDGQYGTLHLHADGSYTYDAKVNSDLPSGALVDQFVYTVEDGDGDFSTTTLDVTVTKVAPNSDCEIVTVDEAALDKLQTGDDLAPGTVTGSHPASPDETQTGQLLLDPGVTVVDGFDQTGSHGQLHVDADGKFVYTLTSNELFGPLNDGPQVIAAQETFDIKVQDAHGNTTIDTVQVNIKDDVPTAKNDAITMTVPNAPTADVQFIVDVSGSMYAQHWSVPGLPDNGVGLERYAMQQMLQTHTQIQNVQIVLFDDNSGHTVWMTRADALTFLANDANFTGGGKTDYDGALTEAMNAYGSSPRPAGQSDQTLVYFFSDGNPNEPHSDPGITNDGAGSNVSVGEWENFVNANGIADTYAVGVGAIFPFQIGELNPISYPNTDTQAPIGQEDNVLVLNGTDVSGVSNTLNQFLTPPTPTPITGDVTANDVAGADGYGSGKLFSVAYNGTTHTFDVSHHEFIIDLGAGRGSLDIKDDGTYTYTPPASNADGTPFQVSYTIQDGDGDHSTAFLKIDLNNPPAKPTDTNAATNTVAENVSNGATVGITAHATDADDATVTYSLTDSAGGAFKIDANTGVVTVANASLIDYESAPGHSYSITVQATDPHGASSSQTFTIGVTDVAPVANDDFIYTTQAFPFTVPDALLTTNDTDVHSNPSVLSITGVSAGGNAGYFDSLSHSGGAVTIDVDETGSKFDPTFLGNGDSTSFTYTVSDSSKTDTGAVSVTYFTGTTIDRSADAHNDIIVGDSSNETLKGGSGNDVIGGGGGSDHIFGNGGDDALIFGSGSTYDGGSGFDRLVVGSGGNAITFDAGKFLGIEMMDLGEGNDRSGAANQNTLAINASDVATGLNAGSIGGHTISLFVVGDTAGSGASNHDNVHLTNVGAVVTSGSFTDPLTGTAHTYDVYQSTAHPSVYVAVEQGLNHI